MPEVRNWLFSAVAMVSLLMSASSNLPPRLIMPGPILASENESIGKCLAKLDASDPDPGARLTFKIEKRTETDLVILNNTQGNASTGQTIDIVLAKQLDRDKEPSQRYIHVSVSDGVNVVYGTVLLYISDVNDEKPVFHQSTYRITVNESIHQGSLVIQVTANDTDEGIGGRVFYGMSPNAQDADDDYKNTFAIEKTTGRITLKNSSLLDYEKRSFYQFKLHAWDTYANRSQAVHLADDADLVISVLDVQDSPPYFVNEPYTSSFKENSKTGTSVLKVTAYDGDRGIPNNITYTFTEPYQHFSINASTGVISIAKMVDADDKDVINHGGVFKMNVTATEVPTPGITQSGENQTTASVSITVLDVNDNQPTFQNNSYTASVQENTPDGVPITLTNPIEVFDKDQGENSEFTIHLEKDGLPYTDFDTLPEINQTVFSKTNVIIRVRNSSVLDYEKTTQITFQVIAREKSTTEHFNNSTTITLTIEDVNDNSPEFNTDPVHFNVSEDVKNGSIVGSVSAVDKDSGDYGTVFYKLENESGNTNFGIMKNNGSIYVTGKLDRETKASYSLFVVAWDNENGTESSRRSARKRVQISLLDVNDSPPVFSGKIPKTEVAEDIPVNTTVLFVSASDPDLDANAIVQYDILHTNVFGGFGINATTGAIFVNKSLIDEVGDRNITVIATNEGNSSMNATQVVMFYIRDVNNNAPKFVYPVVNNQSTIVQITVLEGQPINTTVIKLNATDADRGNNGKVVYRIVADNGNDWDMFKVESLTGILRTKHKLDRETQPSYLFEVQAQDNGIPQLATTIKLNVTLLDIDDEVPMFDDKLPSPYPMQVTEENSTACVGSIAKATDNDEYANYTKICYFIYGGEGASNFVLNKTTGELCLGKSLDREKQTSVNLVVQALANCSAQVPPSGSYNDSDSSQLKVHVKVLDINDQPPVFSKAYFTQGILFDTKLGEVVYHLQDKVTDADVGENATTYFRLMNIMPSAEIKSDSTTDKAFVVDTNGSVATNMLFSSAMLGHFVLKIQAYDIGNLTADTELKIFIISNIQRVKIIFRGKVPDEVKKHQDGFISELESLLGYIIIVDAITSHQKPDKTYDDTSTDMFINARYNTTEGGVVPATELWRAFDFTPGVNYIFEKYGVSETSPVVYEQVKDDSTERDLTMGFIIVAIGLAILAIALGVALYVVRGKYVRRLKSYRTKAEVKTQDVAAHPGTNVYASNPVFNKAISIVDIDAVSVNSLDDNAVDHGKKSLEPYDEQEMTMQIFGEVRNDVRDSSGFSTLDAVLRRYEKEEGGHIKLKHSRSTPKKDEDTDSGTFMPLDATGLEHSDI